VNGREGINLKEKILKWVMKISGIVFAYIFERR